MIDDAAASRSSAVSALPFSFCAIFAIACLACGAAANSSPELPANPPAGSSEARAIGETQALLEKAADEEGVPRSLLEAVAWVDSRWSMHASELSDESAGGCGLFDLREASAAFARAAQLTGYSSGRICSDVLSSAHAGASLLRDEMNFERARYPDLREENLGDWYAAVMRLSGNTDALIADGYAAQVYRILGNGLSAIAPDGALVRIAPQSFSTQGRALNRDSSLYETDMSGDYCPGGACVAFLPASSMNFEVGREGANINYIVIHDMESSYASAIAHFQDPTSDVSAHYLLQSSDGAMTQMVHDVDTAWHTGNHDYNIGGIGIEHEGYAAEGTTWYTEAMYQSSAALTRWLSDTLSIPRDRTHIIGHYEVPDASHAGWYGGVNHHHDPCDAWAGDPTWHNNVACYWDWDHYLSLVNGQTSGATNGTLTGFVGDACCGIAAGTRKPLVGALVSLSGTSLSAMTDSTGTYSFSLAPGTYTPMASLNGYISADHSSLGMGYPAAISVTSSATAFGSIVLQSSAPVAHAPVITISSPINDSSVNTSSISVSGTLDDPSVTSVEIDGQTFAASGGAFSGTAALVSGANTITVSATNAAGTGSASVTVTDSPITTGIAGHILGLSAVKLAGAQVSLNPGALSAVSAADGSYAFAVVPGHYTISVAIPAYQPFSAVVVVTAGPIQELDLQLTATTTPSAPSVRIDTPSNGQMFSVALVTVSGYAFVPNLAAVNIGGEATSFDSSGAFQAQVALPPGTSTITVSAVDKTGTTLTASVSVTYLPETESSHGCNAPGADSLLMLMPLLMMYMHRRRAYG